MSTSQIPDLQSEIESDEPLSEGAQIQIGARARLTFFDFLVKKLKEAEKNGLTKTALAKRLGKDKGQVSKLLSGPGNWTIDTAANLLAAICREELLPQSISFVARKPGTPSAEVLLQTLLRSDVENSENDMILYVTTNDDGSLSAIRNRPSSSSENDVIRWQNETA